MIENIIRDRRTIRKFKPDAVDKETIKKLIEMATLAPSASNKQPWRFYVIENRAIISQMADAIQSAVDQISQHIEPTFLNIFEQYGDYFTRFVNAPIVIAVAYSKLVTLSNLVSPALDENKKHEIADMENISGLMSTSLAVQNLLLYAHSLGLGTSCMTGPLIAKKNIERILEIPAAWELGALVPVGYPAETPVAPTRKPFEKMIKWL